MVEIMIVSILMALIGICLIFNKCIKEINISNEGLVKSRLSTPLSIFQIHFFQSGYQYVAKYRCYYLSKLSKPLKL